MKKDFLDSLNVKSPCHESWEKMTGNDQIRFCSHCAKDVHDLSAMTRPQAERLVKNSNGNLCVRYVKTPQGKLMTAPPKFTQIKRQARAAGSVLATSLALSTFAYSQGEPIKPKEDWTQTVKKTSKIGETENGFSTISGTVMDWNEAVIVGAKITLRDVNNQKVRQTLTDEDGVYKFAKVEPNVYAIEIESPGFKKLIVEGIVVAQDEMLEQSAVLEVGAIMGELVMIEEPLETSEPASNQTIQPLPILELPKNPQTFTMMGLIPGACLEDKPKPQKTNKKKN